MTTLDPSKSDLLTDLTQYAATKPAPVQADVDLPTLVRLFYRHVAADELAERDVTDLFGSAVSVLRLAASRPQGTARVAVFTPQVSTHGWSAGGHTVVEVVTDDMPFLVDSVTMALDSVAGGEHEVHRVVHPQLACRRDVGGELRAVLGETRDEPADAAGEASDGLEVARESWMHLEIARVPDEDLDGVRERLGKVLVDVRDAVEDWAKMRARAAGLVEVLRQDPPPLPADEVEQGAALLDWLADDHFTFLGYREYDLVEVDGHDQLHARPGTGLGILRSDPPAPRALPEAVARHARDPQLLVLAKANSRATVHRPVFLDYVGVKEVDAEGRVVGERRFLGLFSSAAYTESVKRIPVLREKVATVVAEVGFDPLSHAGKALLDVLETYPRDELFQTPVADLVPIAVQVMQTRERRALRLFVRRDTYARFWSVLVYLPRDRYNTSVRERIAAILSDRLGGEPGRSDVEFSARVGESSTARLHFVLRPAGGPDRVDPSYVADLERRCSDAARSWRDDFASATVAAYGEERGSRYTRTYADSFPEAYKEDYPPAAGAVDLGRLEELLASRTGDEPAMSLALYSEVTSPPDQARLKVYRVGAPLSLSEILPILSTTGVEVVDERPYHLERLPSPTYIYDFGLRYGQPLPDGTRELFQDTVTAVWQGRNESDGFNALVLAAGLTWRQAMLLRAYAKHMRQGGTPFAQDYIEDALRLNVPLTRLLVQLFEARFDPGDRHDLPADSEARQARCTEVETRIEQALEEVTSLDHDRILRSYLASIRATLRTSYFVRDASGEPLDRLSLKLDPQAIPDLPAPRPRFEIFVYSPRVEGVHLRFGAVARGGLRWSDRRDDFRTEVLGLVKAQMVKNTVIVPVGAKGGFFAKQLPDPGADRAAWLAEGQAAYRTFVSGLLDLTDNLSVTDEGRTVLPPQRVVRHDGDDTYLVVAADKGTATFSDLANEISASYDFWLGDAFASGGSVGYDHKAMGITARGAWVSVRRHFREMGIDCQTEPFTAVGIGDMSGDVFGNGMLCSPTTRLVAAFDHRDVFVDPDPDPETSYAERQRLFGLLRSSWQDYDTSLISAGGGVWSRTAKSVPVSAQVREALGLDDSVVRLTPAELIRAILLAPVDLLWNGGIGTYVKAAEESSAQVGDKANDAIRVDGHELRVRCVGEGGNLGLTQLGRIEYARRGAQGEGGRLATDFIDNSAGVDTSDREVNIKILLDRVVADGDLTGKQRNELLASMTDQVAELVLHDNYEQNIALANAQAIAPALLHVHEDWIRTLERRGVVDRELEGLPSRRTVARRRDRDQGLTTPELAVLLSWTKIVLADELVETDLPDDPFVRSELFSYFPSGMRQGYRGQMDQHPLRREIVVTQLVNQLVNNAGITYVHRLRTETGASAAELTRANLVAREIFGAERVLREIASFDNQVDAALQTRMRLEVRTLVERASRWLLNARRLDAGTEAVVDAFEVVVERVVAELPSLMTGVELTAYDGRLARLVEAGVPETLASRVACCQPAFMVLGVVETATRLERDPMEVARTHFAVGERFELPQLLAAIIALPRLDRWQTMARAALRDDLHVLHAQLTAAELEGEPVAEDVAEQAVDTLREILAEEVVDLARLSVALRVVRGLL